MVPESPKPIAVFIYSERDELLRQGLADYLSRLQDRGLLGELRYYCLESFGTSRLAQLIEQADLFFFLYSVSLMAHLPPGNAALERLAREHKLKRLQMVALLARAWDLSNTPFQSALALPEGQRPILSTAWSSPHEAYEHLYEKLEEACRDRARYKAALEAAWAQASAQHEIGGYREFLQQYPFSRYAKLARAAISRLDEDQLWAKAQSSAMAEGYSDYLIKSPLHEQITEASQRIAEIEEDEALNWQEAQAQHQIEFYFRYKAAFPQGNHLAQADQAIQELLSKQLAFKEDGYQPGGMNSNYLLYEAYRRKLQPEALFALDSFLNYCWALRNQADRVSRNHPNQLFFLIIFALIFIFEFLILRQFGFFWGQGEPLGLQIGKLVAIAGFNLVLLRQMYWSLEWLALDQRYLEAARSFLRRAGVQLKAAMLASDLRWAQQILGELVKIEQKQQEIEKRSLLQYLLNASAGVLSKGQPTIREAYPKAWMD
jgi:hypothetical protein